MPVSTLTSTSVPPDGVDPLALTQSIPPVQNEVLQIAGVITDALEIRDVEQCQIRDAPLEERLRLLMACTNRAVPDWYQDPGEASHASKLVVFVIRVPGAPPAMSMHSVTLGRVVW